MRSQFDDDGMRPDVGEVVGQVSAAFRRNFRRSGPIILLVVVALLLVTGFYKVDPGEIAVVRTFGKETGKKQPGLHYRIPFAQKVDIENVEQIRRIEVGTRGEERVPHEALMLTGDENIVEAHMIVQYRIVEPTKALFRLRDPEETLRATAEVALRSMVGRTSIDDVLKGEGREKTQRDTMTWLQKLMDEYDSGLQVTEVKLQAVDAPDEVKDAFHDVVRAREEKEKLINQARGYEADKIPRARGEARKHIREAEAYKEQRVLRAQGDAEKFTTVYAEYKKAPKVTRDRLYLETMERLYGKIDNKIIVDGAIAKGALPVLPLGGAAVGALAGGGKQP